MHLISEERVRFSATPKAFHTADDEKAALDLEIRPLAANDFDIADIIFATAFRRSRTGASEMPLFHALQPDGRYIARTDGKPVGLVGMIDYGSIAYIGPVAVLPEYQSKGIGRALMEYVIAVVRSKGPRVMLLEATPDGARFYPQLGFVTDATTQVYRLLREQPSTGWFGRVRPMQPEDITAVAAFDTPIFGADRTRVLDAYLRRLPKRAFVALDENDHVSGYLFAQARRLGPWAARRIEDAETMLRAALTLRFDQPPDVVMPGSNAAGIRLLEGRGFAFERSMLHMRFGGDGPIGQRSLLYGLASPGIG